MRLWMSGLAGLELPSWVRDIHSAKPALNFDFTIEYGWLSFKERFGLALEAWWGIALATGRTSLCSATTAELWGRFQGLHLAWDRGILTWLQRWIANMTLNLFLPQDWCLMPIFSNHCIKELTNTEWQITIKWYMWPNLRIKLEVILLILRPNLQVPYLSAFTIYVLDYW